MQSVMQERGGGGREDSGQPEISGRVQGTEQETRDEQILECLVTLG